MDRGVPGRQLFDMARANRTPTRYPLMGRLNGARVVASTSKHMHYVCVHLFVLPAIVCRYLGFYLKRYFHLEFIFYVELLPNNRFSSIIAFDKCMYRVRFASALQAN